MIESSAVLRAVAIVDVVDSVRLITRFGAEFIDRWRATVRHLGEALLPTCGGQLVSHRGDGAVLVFDDVPLALKAVLDLGRWLDDRNTALDPERRISLRTAIHHCEIIVDEIDAFGAGVNVAARLAAHAQPGQVLLSREAAERLHPALDPPIEDLGFVYLKHLDREQRIYRAVRVDSVATPLPPPSDPLRPTVAVLPFEQPGTEAPRVGDLLADELICALSALPELRVVSRLSARIAAARGAGAADCAQMLSADYVLSGHCHVLGERVVVHAELFDSLRGELVDTWRCADSVHELTADGSPFIASLLERVGRSLLKRQVDMAARCALPHLAGYTLLLASVTLMHRMSKADVARAGEMLVHLCDRWPRLAAPHAWRARWHLFNVIQGFSGDIEADRRGALDASRRALDTDPQSAVALAVAGSVRVGLERDVDGGLGLYRAAVEANPSDAFAWTLMSAAHAFKGEGALAARTSLQAGRLSPIDPLHFLYDCHAASAALAADESSRALVLAERSLRANSQHTSTLRVLAIAQMLEDRPIDAQLTVSRLRHLSPQYCVDQFLRQSPSAAYPIGRRFAALLAEAGLPQTTQHDNAEGHSA